MTTLIPFLVFGLPLIFLIGLVALAWLTGIAIDAEPDNGHDID